MEMIWKFEIEMAQKFTRKNNNKINPENKTNSFLTSPFLLSYTIFIKVKKDNNKTQDGNVEKVEMERNKKRLNILIFNLKIWDAARPKIPAD